MSGRRLLHRHLIRENSPGLWIDRANWMPYPTASDRAAWESLPGSLRAAHMERGREAAQTDWPHLPADVYLQFARDGNRSHFEALYFKRRDILSTLVIAECMLGDGTFLPQIANCAWWLCEESSWCLPAHLGAQKAGVGLPDVDEPVVDLFAAETAALLAWTVYLLRPQLDAFHPEIHRRVLREVHRRVLAPALTRDDFWWMGFHVRPVNNWNPWICSNWLACVLLLEEDTQPKAAGVTKIAQCLDHFLDDYPQDGGCDEGPSYWGRAGASLFDCLELLYSASGGLVDLFNEPLIQEIGRYVYRAHIAGDYYLNFADAPAVLIPDAMLVVRYGMRTGDTQMVRFGAWLAERADLFEQGYRSQRSNRSASLLRELPALFGWQDVESISGAPPLLGDVWLPETQVMAARDRAGSEQGLYMAVKGGHNAESHNHNDVGHFVVYKHGRPMIVDVGVETYSRKTFSPQRYEIWTMQSAYHSLPTVGGWMQAPGREFHAANARYRSDAGGAELALEIGGAYPPEAHILRWERSVRLDRGAQVLLRDAFELAEAQEIYLSLMTACRPELKRAGVVHLHPVELVEGRFSADGEIRYDPDLFSVEVEQISVTDARLSQSWGGRLFRLVFRLRAAQQAGTWELAFA